MCWSDWSKSQGTQDVRQQLTVPSDDRTSLVRLWVGRVILVFVVLAVPGAPGPHEKAGVVQRCSGAHTLSHPSTATRVAHGPLQSPHHCQHTPFWRLPTWHTTSTSPPQQQAFPHSRFLRTPSPRSPKIQNANRVSLKTTEHENYSVFLLGTTEPSDTTRL